MELPLRPPFVLRARVLTPLAAGGTRYESDGVVAVDPAGRISAVDVYDPWLASHEDPLAVTVLDLRPWLVMPGLVDLHVHLPQVPAAGVGAGLDLMTWLDRYIFPLERSFDAAAADRLVPQILRAMARTGTTTMLAYGAIWPDSLDAAFRAAEAHGIRAVIGKVMMDELTYDERIPRERILDVSLRQSAELCERWHGADEGR
ncbi:MAG: amidohydrolase family protein, partial [Chloroflexota bacterium]|nr:amidohydrolase family protein [Chloroflexota bacterium]